VDHRDSGPPWTGLRRRPEELTRALPTGALVHGSSPRPLGKHEELVRVRSRASPEVEEQRGGRATAVLGESAAQSWREGKGSGERCGETRWGVLTFYRGPVMPGVEIPVGNGRGFMADAIDGRGGGVLTGVQEGESRRGSKGL
jgi:hypothetical protein